MNGKNQPPKPQAASPAYYLRTCLIVSGASALSIVMAGAELLGPLEAAPAVIAAALLALAIGHAWGGRLADRAPYLTLFAKLLLMAGLTVAVIPALRDAVLGASVPLDARLGTFVASAILLGPALLLLGTLPPLAARLAATGAADSGRSAGDAWALWAAGGAAGAALTGFVLLPLWPAPRVLLACAAVLIALGAWGTWLSARRLPLGQLSTCAAGLLLAALSNPG